MNPAHASAIALFATLPNLAVADYDRHVLFDSAPAPGGYYDSWATCIAPCLCRETASSPFAAFCTQCANGE